jgi:phage N-6-adenine-methyltransferase
VSDGQRALVEQLGAKVVAEVALAVPDPVHDLVEPGWCEKYAAPRIESLTTWDELDEAEALLTAKINLVEQTDVVELHKAMRFVEARRGSLVNRPGQGARTDLEPSSRVTEVAKAAAANKCSEATVERWCRLADHWDNELREHVLRATDKTDVTQGACLALVRGDSGNWETPSDLYDVLDAEFGFELDVCATEATAKCARYFTPEQDGLAQRWDGTCWCNPPYGEIGKWVAKAHEAAESGATVVCLLPASTGAAWWWDHVRHAEIRFLRGRLRFGDAVGVAPFDSAVVVFGRRARVVWWQVPRTRHDRPSGRPSRNEPEPTPLRERAGDPLRA